MGVDQFLEVTTIVSESSVLGLGHLGAWATVRQATIAEQLCGAVVRERDDLPSRVTAWL